MARRPNNFLQDRGSKDYSHAQITSTTTLTILTVPAGRSLIIDRVQYMNPTGLAADASNYVAIQIINPDTDVAASWSTQSGHDGTLTAGTCVNLNLSTSGDDLAFASGAAVKFKVLVTGAPTLPAGEIRVEYHLD